VQAQSTIVESIYYTRVAAILPAGAPVPSIS
jgi:hypothetical protein